MVVRLQPYNGSAECRNGEPERKGVATELRIIYLKVVGIGMKFNEIGG